MELRESIRYIFLVRAGQTALFSIVKSRRTVYNVPYYLRLLTHREQCEMGLKRPRKESEQQAESAIADRELRARLGLTQEQFAAKVSVT